MEYELHPDGKVTPLPKQNVDTGLGLERTAAIQQGVISVYETDGYQAIMDRIAAERSRVTATRSGDEGPSCPRRSRARHDVLIAEGVRPQRGTRLCPAAGSSAGRRPRRHRAEGLPARSCDVVIEQMGPWYPELDENRERDPARRSKAEEERFSQTSSAA